MIATIDFVIDLLGSNVLSSKMSDLVVLPAMQACVTALNHASRRALIGHKGRIHFKCHYATSDFCDMVPSPPQLAYGSPALRNYVSSSGSSLFCESSSPPIEVMLLLKGIGGRPLLASILAKQLLDTTSHMIMEHFGCRI